MSKKIYGIPVTTPFNPEKIKTQGTVVVSNASAGQMVIIKTVDESGNPTEWEAVDRSHGKEVSISDVILPHTYVRFTSGATLVAGFTENLPEVGKSYVVNWNGTEYTCEAYLDDDIVHLGNSSLAGGSVNSTEPFCIVGIGTSRMVFKNTETTETIPIKAGGVENVVYHKLDNKYLDLDWLPVTKQTYILPETAFTLEGDEYVTGGKVESVTQESFEPYGGATVKVLFDGNEYDCVVSYETSAACFGNMWWINSSLTDTGEPFAVIVQNNIFAFYADLGDHTIAVLSVEPNKMPEEFLPDSVATVEKVLAALPTWEGGSY